MTIHENKFKCKCGKPLYEMFVEYTILPTDGVYWAWFNCPHCNQMWRVPPECVTGHTSYKVIKNDNTK